MNPTLMEKYGKAITSFVVFAFAAVALFWGGNIFGFHITADFQSKCEALIPLAAGVVAVFGVKSATEDDWSKAIMQLVAGVIAVISFFHAVPADTGVQIGAAVYALVAAVFAVKKTPNHPSTVAIHEGNLPA